VKFDPAPRSVSRREQVRLFLVVGMQVSLMHVLHHPLEELGFGAGAFGLEPVSG